MTIFIVQYSNFNLKIVNNNKTRGQNCFVRLEPLNINEPLFLFIIIAAGKQGTMLLTILKSLLHQFTLRFFLTKQTRIPANWHVQELRNELIIKYMSLIHVWFS